MWRVESAGEIERVDFVAELLYADIYKNIRGSSSKVIGSVKVVEVSGSGKFLSAVTTLIVPVLTT
jgi:hypothetical protein